MVLLSTPSHYLDAKIVTKADGLQPWVWLSGLSAYETDILASSRKRQVLWDPLFGIAQAHSSCHRSSNT